MKISQNSNNQKTMSAMLLVCVLGITALYEATLGFRVVSTEAGRRLHISERPLLLPATEVALPALTQLHEKLREDGRVAIITFMYSSCNAVCSAIGSQYQQMQSEIISRGLQHKVSLLSVSFDERDTPTVLQEYAIRHHALSAVWQFASIPDVQQRKTLLSSFGIVVVPVPVGEFQHNAAFHIVDREGRLRRIVGLDNQQDALQYAVATMDAP